MVFEKDSSKTDNGLIMAFPPVNSSPDTTNIEYLEYIPKFSIKLSIKFLGLDYRT